MLQRLYSYVAEAIQLNSHVAEIIDSNFDLIGTLIWLELWFDWKLEEKNIWFELWFDWKFRANNWFELWFDWKNRANNWFELWFDWKHRANNWFELWFDKNYALWTGLVQGVNLHSTCSFFLGAKAPLQIAWVSESVSQSAKSLEISVYK